MYVYIYILYIQIMSTALPGHIQGRKPHEHPRRGPGWRIHGSVEDTKLSTIKQHTLSCASRD